MDIQDLPVVRLGLGISASEAVSIQELSNRARQVASVVHAGQKVLSFLIDDEVLQNASFLNENGMYVMNVRIPPVVQLELRLDGKEAKGAGGCLLRNDAAQQKSTNEVATAVQRSSDLQAQVGLAISRDDNLLQRMAELEAHGALNTGPARKSHYHGYPDFWVAVDQEQVEFRSYRLRVAVADPNLVDLTARLENEPQKMRLQKGLVTSASISNFSGPGLAWSNQSFRFDTLEAWQVATIECAKAFELPLQLKVRPTTSTCTLRRGCLDVAEICNLRELVELTRQKLANVLAHLDAQEQVTELSQTG